MNNDKFLTKMDDSLFPIVKFKFGKTIKNMEEFEELKKCWLKQYLKKQNFFVVFDTSEMEKLPMHYLYKLSKFAGDLKKLNPEDQHLKASILLIKNDFVRKLYGIYLKLQKPISKIYIVKEMKDVNIILDMLINNKKVVGYKEYNC
jgi:hypothetical protein